MRKLLIIAFSLVVFSITGCLKDTPSTDLSHVGTIMEIMYPYGAQDYGVGSGLEYFSGEQLPFFPTDVADTAVYYINIAGANTLSQPLTVTIAVNNSALEDNISNDGITYIALPDSCYTLLPTSGTIPAGQRIDTFRVAYYPSKINLTQNYNLPITFTTSPSYTVAGNFGTLYLHTIGDPIAGTYTWVNTTYADSAGTGPSTNNASGPGIFAPLDATDVEFASGATIPGSGGPINYILSFANNNGTLSNFTVALDPNTVPSNIIITSGPNVVLADPVHNIYTLNFTDSIGGTGTGAGSTYNITDNFTFVSNY
jgi:hypothetical protein